VSDWSRLGDVALVVGATYPEELAVVRTIVGDMPLLVPGIGAQGGDVESTVRWGQDSTGYGMMINSSRSIIYASSARPTSNDDFASAARSAAQDLLDQIRNVRTP
jgi:orotidine-5'-phosphate decarboxylase